MQLIKIGGTVFKNFDGFSKLVKIIDSYSKKPLIVVISAFANATKTLRQAAKTAETGKLSQAKNLVDGLIKEHKNLAEKLITEQDVFDSLIYLFDNSRERIFELLKGISITNELTPRTLDNIMSYGEFFALHTIYHYLLEKNFNIHSIDSTSLIVSDDNFGNAKPIIDLTTKAVKTKLKPLLKKDNIILTQGFVAKTRLGDITTMGIESSNLTAVLLSEILGIKEITYWTDVEGIRTADPKLINNTLSIKHLSYKLAYSLSVNGLKLIYPEMIEHTEKNKIKLIYKSAFKPNGEFTVIDNNSNYLKEHIVLLNSNLFYHKIIFVNDKEKLFLNDFLSTFKSKSNIMSVKFSEESASFVTFVESAIPNNFANNFSDYSKLNVSQIVIFSNEPAKSLSELADLIRINKKSILEVFINTNSIKIITLQKNPESFLNKIHKKLTKKN